MGRRKDAMIGAARAILEVSRVGNAYGPDGRSNAPISRSTLTFAA